MVTITHRFQAWKHVWTSLGFVVGVLLVVSVIARLSWYDYAELRDGRRGRVLAVSVAPHTVTVQLDGVPVQVATGAIAALKPGARNLLRQANGQFLLGAILLAFPIPFLYAVRVRLLLARVACINQWSPYYGSILAWAGRQCHRPGFCRG